VIYIITYNEILTLSERGEEDVEALKGVRGHGMPLRYDAEDDNHFVRE
jgi:hypothetical protein